MAQATSEPRVGSVWLFRTSYHYLSGATSKEGGYNYYITPFDPSLHLVVERAAHALAESDNFKRSKERYWELAKAHIAARVAGDFKLNILGGRLVDSRPIDDGLLEALIEVSKMDFAAIIPNNWIDRIRECVLGNR